MLFKSIKKSKNKKFTKKAAVAKVQIANKNIVSVLDRMQSVRNCVSVKIVKMKK